MAKKERETAKTVVCRHNYVRQQIQAFNAGAGVHLYAINPNS